MYNYAVMKKYGYFIFDWDGCLAKTLEVWLRAYKDMYAEYGVYPTDLEIARRFGEPYQHVAFGVTDEAFLPKIKARAEVALEAVELYPGARQLLQALKGRPVALVTGSHLRRNVEHSLAKYGVDGCFDVIITGQDVTNPKPDPEGINKALEVLGGTPETAVMVGDSHKDLEAAQNAGIDSLLTYPPEHNIFYDLKDLQRHNPTYTVRSFAEAEAILLAK